MNTPDTLRNRAIRRVEEYLRQKDMPRLHMFLIVSLTGASGFLFSFLMLKSGLDQMWLRYPVAVGLAYLVFFLLLRVWLTYQASEGTPPDAGDVLDAAGNLPWDLCDTRGDVGTDAVDHPIPAVGLDLDEAWFIVLAVVGLLGGILACLYVIWSAPSLLAEVFLDGALVAGLYNRMRKRSQPHWIYGAVRRTWVPTLLVAVFCSVAGYAMQRVAPDARSLGPVVEHLLRK